MTTLQRDLVQALTEAGVPEDRARAVAEQLAEVATKQDLDALRLELEASIESLRAESKLRFDHINERFDDLNRTMWRVFLIGAGVMTGMMGALIGAIVVLATR